MRWLMFFVLLTGCEGRLAWNRWQAYQIVGQPGAACCKAAAMGYNVVDLDCGSFWVMNASNLIPTGQPCAAVP